MKVLYTSAELHRAIRGVLQAPAKHERRVALVSYVGGQAEAFLPDPKGLEIICALKPGATSAEAIQRLQTRGATVRQSSRLHMKVYWSSARGCIICSANASANALGRQGLKEAGVWLPRGSVNVDELLRYARPVLIRDSDLKKLARANDVVAAAVRQRVEPGERPSFTEWLQMAGHKPWKLACWTEESLVVAKLAKSKARTTFGVGELHDAISGRKGQYGQGDWLLCSRLPAGVRADWMYVDFVVRVPRSDRRAYDASAPYHAVQVNAPSRYPYPPFRLDRGFREALKKAVKEVGAKSLENARSLRPSARFLRILSEAYR